MPDVAASFPPTTSGSKQRPSVRLVLAGFDDKLRDHTAIPKDWLPILLRRGAWMHVLPIAFAICVVGRLVLHGVLAFQQAHAG